MKIIITVPDKKTCNEIQKRKKKDESDIDLDIRFTLQTLWHDQMVQFILIGVRKPGKQHNPFTTGLALNTDVK